jgi:hypothetical protein
MFRLVKRIVRNYRETETQRAGRLIRKAMARPTYRPCGER